jgi:glyoxylase-like metal-dependent hydrolase (beta-lactamase superfamily II)
MRVHILVPAQRYVFAVSNGEAEAAAVDSSAEGFQRYKQHRRAVGPGDGCFPEHAPDPRERDYVVDPGLIMQGAPVIGALAELGVGPGEIRDVILTHLHFDHAEGLAAWPTPERTGRAAQDRTRSWSSREPRLEGRS